MNRRARQILLIALLASAICADRASAAAPALRPVVGQIARSLTGRLTVSFARILPAVRIQQARQESVVRLPALPIWQAIELPRMIHSGFSAFQFRLPPPVA